MRWRNDLNEFQADCPSEGCGGYSRVERFDFTGNGSFVGLNECERCGAHFMGSLTLSVIMEKMKDNASRGIMTARDCLTDSKTRPLTEEEVDGFIEGWDNGAIWEELGE